MSGHPRLLSPRRRVLAPCGGPADIKASYPKQEETFSLRTTDFREAVKRVRVEAMRVDQLYEEHRRQLQVAGEAPLEEHTPQQLKHVV